jgi:hypothetical protein
VRLGNTRSSTKRLNDDTRHLSTIRRDQGQVCSHKLTNGFGALWMIHQTILFGFLRLTIFNTLSRSAFRVNVLLTPFSFPFSTPPKTTTLTILPTNRDVQSSPLHSAPLRSRLHTTDNRAGSLAALVAQRHHQPALLFLFPSSSQSFMRRVGPLHSAYVGADEWGRSDGGRCNGRQVVEWPRRLGPQRSGGDL